MIKLLIIPILMVVSLNSYAANIFRTGPDSIQPAPNQTISPKTPFSWEVRFKVEGGLSYQVKAQPAVSGGRMEGYGRLRFKGHCENGASFDNDDDYTSGISAIINTIKGPTICYASILMDAPKGGIANFIVSHKGNTLYDIQIESNDWGTDRVPTPNLTISPSSLSLTGVVGSVINSNFVVGINPLAHIYKGKLRVVANSDRRYLYVQPQGGWYKKIPPLGEPPAVLWNVTSPNNVFNMNVQIDSKDVQTTSDTARLFLTAEIF